MATALCTAQPRAGATGQISARRDSVARATATPIIVHASDATAATITTCVIDAMDAGAPSEPP